MATRFVVEFRRKHILCAGSELSVRVFRSLFLPTLFTIKVAVG